MLIVAASIGACHGQAGVTDGSREAGPRHARSAVRYSFDALLIDGVGAPYWLI
jgi:hypothetical protein